MLIPALGFMKIKIILHIISFILFRWLEFESKEHFYAQPQILLHFF